jgi:hypothetical protein
LFEINPSKLLTITALLDGTFPAFKSTNNKPTPMITPMTVGYIHALIIDTVSLYQSDSPNARALRVEIMARDELIKLDHAVFRNELMTCFTSYYEGILTMEGTSGLPLAVAYKRSFNAVPPPPMQALDEASVAKAAPDLADPAAAAAAPDDAAAAPAAAAAVPAAAAAVPAAAAAPAKPAPGRVRGGRWYA